MQSSKIWSFILAISTALLSAQTAPVWHEPANPHPDLGGPSMRNPLYEAADNDLVIYQGFFKNFGANGDQNGGNLHYRTIPRGGSPSAWNSTPLNFFSNVGGNQFWSATLPSSGFGPTDVIEYYIEVTFSGSSPETTYLHGGDLINNFSSTTSEASAQASPYSVRNRPGWIFHAGNVTAADTDLNLQLKTGYIGSDNDPETRWADSGAVYYTIDGSEPEGSLGTASGSSSAVPLTFDGTQRDNSGNGNAALWRATLPGVLQGLPLGSQVRYKIGLWNSATNEEKFADHGTATDNDTFIYQNGQLGEPSLTVNGLSANYTTSKLFVDEIAGDSIPLEINFEPGEDNVTEVEIYTNLNRRDRADEDANNDGYDDGISGLDGNDLVAGDDSHYYKAYPMNPAGTGSYSLTLPAEKTGAYRLTARWKVQGDPEWRWYSNGEANRRDHAITISPVDARKIQLYEINVLNIEATDDSFENRSTIEDMHNAPNALHNGNNRWDLDYLKSLGCNWLWFQPVHPAARDGREPFGGWANSDNPPYEPGSPYAVRNFFEINPVMTRAFSGDPFTDSDILAQSNRDAAMDAWRNFMVDADAKQVGIMLDAPFNHTGFDVELGVPGVELFQPDGASWDQHDQIRNREARFFSAEGNYAERASSAANIAPGPDRFDFGKWPDVKDVYFGRYDSLVETDTEPERSSYTNEGDWFDFGNPNWTNDDFTQNGEPRNITRQVWKYFATYATYWLDQTRPSGENRNSETEPGLSLEERYIWDARGIDGLRCDFGQGLPPRCWEYIINVARERKWNFVMMSESLDGGAVTYRSNRHFDILNENIVFPLKTATTNQDYREIFEGRRNAYGQGLVLTNNVSHDEENYEDPWQALIRYAVASTIDGAPMIFPGQELGVSRNFGYNHYEVNFGKTIPHFKRYNSMQPIWNQFLEGSNFGSNQLLPVYAGIGAARQSAPSLRSSNRWFLDGNGFNSEIHAIAKYEVPFAAPSTSDVTLNFVNLNREGSPSDVFRVPAPLADLIGLQEGRIYNTKNIAAYEASQTGRGDLWLWGDGYTRQQLIDEGFFVQLNRVPIANSEWIGLPYEAQYLKVYDITAPTASGPQVQATNAFGYALQGSTTFRWDQLAPDEAGIVPAYELSVSIDGEPNGTLVTSANEATINAEPGQEVSITITPVNPDFTDSKGTAGLTSQSVRILAPEGDDDQDGQSNQSEDTAGVNPLDNTSFFAIKRIQPRVDANEVIIDSVTGRSYTLESSSTLQADSWITVGEPILGNGAEIALSDTGSSGLYYRVRVTR